MENDNPVCEDRQKRGTNCDEYQIYLSCADDGQGGDITRDGAPLLSYDDWLDS